MVNKKERQLIAELKKKDYKSTSAKGLRFIGSAPAIRELKRRGLKVKGHLTHNFPKILAPYSSTLLVRSKRFIYI